MWNTSAAEEQLDAGARLGPYRLEELLGAGGMGIVFRATREDGEEVALKIMREELAGDETFRRRFDHEARSASLVRSPHLVAVLEAGEAGGRYYLASEFVSGPTLEARIREGPLPLDDVVRVACELALALDALHEAGLVHRDVKASNVLLRNGHTAMLTDFGLAKSEAYTVLTKPGQGVLGTLDYLAPELIRGDEATRASDVYALGCVTFECLVGTTPFGGRSVFQIGLAHLDEEPPDPSVARADCPAALAAAVLRALAKDPIERPASAAEYARDLAAAA